MGGAAIGATIADALAVYLGEHTAKVAVKTFTQRTFGRGQETLRLDDVPALLDALRPMMNTLIGKRQCEAILDRLRWELNL